MMNLPKLGHRLKSGLTALAVGIVLLTALDWAAAAATGRSTILGQWNSAGHTTTIKNTGKGPALELRAKGAALAVGNDKRVKNLNADQLDGHSGADYRANRNRIYQWTATDHTGGFTQPLPAQQPGSYLVTFTVQLAGAAGSPDNPNVINCRFIQNGVSGGITAQKGILAEAQVTSVGTPPALTGTSPAILAAGDTLALDCSMSRNGQQWSTTPYQQITVNLLRTDGSDVFGAPLGTVPLARKAMNGSR
jgi:hypothetical protein